MLKPSIYVYLYIRKISIIKKSVELLQWLSDLSDDDHSELDGSAHNSGQEREERRRGGDGTDYRYSHPAFFQLRQSS